ncbi:hypothetical protein CKAH01_04795 [Colletotrichum kahawae]|uniref:Uncharacterized protein n=1 Tax=Colletotrichum kahawae TaxID=34407 RepID=A0AAE0D7X2_COLKA|nr:hypothetical protein CKAH01_04795 [Colletotrichum kahawae]
MATLQGIEIGVGSYVAGAELTLLPMNRITRPYGINHFPWPFIKKSGRRKEPLPRNLATQPSGSFDPDAKPDQMLRLSVTKTLSGGFNKGPQVLLCEVLEAPSAKSSRYTPLELGDRIVIKVFDHECYPQVITFPRPYPPEVVADQDLSREASVFLYMHRIGRDETSKEEPLYRKLTGGMLLAPEYHGTWAIKLDRTNRYVGAVAMEYIDGVSLEDLCTRLDDSGRVYPNILPVPLYDTDEEPQTHGILDMKDESRLKILADILEWVVKVNYSYCRVWEMTYKGIGPLSGRESDNQRLPLPVHPADHFTTREFCDFTGWFPYQWWHDETKFEAWLLEAFGPKIPYEGRKIQDFSLYADLEVHTRMNAARSLPFANEDSIQGLV